MRILPLFPVLTLLLLGLFACPASADPAPEALSALPATEESSASPEAPVPTGPAESGGLFERIKGGFGLHKENYLLPLTWSNLADSAEDAELKYQLSFKQQIYRGLTFAYTQKSFWRILDQDDSRPFRETNYNPEIFYRFHGQAGAAALWGGDIGLEHESNGSREPNSRSWNRVYLTPFFEYGALRAELKLWHRLAEAAKKTPDDPTGDENPDIERFYGYGELRLAYLSPQRHRVSLMTRWNFATDKGAIQLDYSLPTGTKNLFLYGQLWSGYGESLIDYNRSITRYGVGVLIRQ